MFTYRIFQVIFLTPSWPCPTIFAKFYDSPISNYWYWPNTLYQQTGEPIFGPKYRWPLSPIESFTCIIAIYVVRSTFGHNTLWRKKAGDSIPKAIYMQQCLYFHESCPHVYISIGSGIGLGTLDLDDTDNFELHLWFIIFILYQRNELSNRR